MNALAALALAFALAGIHVGGTRVMQIGYAPAWSPSGERIAFVTKGDLWVADADGRHRGLLVRNIYVDRSAVHKDTQPAWRPPRRARELLPDFDQRPPTGLTVAGGPGRWLLGFTSLVDNIGIGPAELVGVRSPGRSRMAGTQQVHLANGKVRTFRDVAQLRYTNSPPHYHWHLMRFDSFELRSPDGQLLVRDRKSGFCLADRYGQAPGTWPGRRPHYLGNCDQYKPSATHVLMGTTPGYTARYPAFFHGQNVDITGVPSGTYVLTHRVNAAMHVRELRYDNDAASVRICIKWDAGYPTVRVLRSCAATPTC